MDSSGAQQPNKYVPALHLLSAERVCTCVEVHWLQEKYMAFQEMLRLFPPFLVEPFKKWLRGLICGPTNCSRRCMEQHSWLPSPHQPRISISFYDCSKHISYWAAWEALTAADTLITKMSVTFLETDGRLFKKKNKTWRKKSTLKLNMRHKTKRWWQGQYFHGHEMGNFQLNQKKGFKRATQIFSC